mmetsp:Transcript_5142/g.12549  ORF Transcript_5142/g.12549 Transcript_5142/m.12549 type:complete len:220 (+) Transcript_5142:2986-3645(+)
MPAERALQRDALLALLGQIAGRGTGKRLPALDALHRVATGAPEIDFCLAWWRRKRDAHALPHITLRRPIMLPGLDLKGLWVVGVKPDRRASLRQQPLLLQARCDVALKHERVQAAHALDLNVFIARCVAGVGIALKLVTWHSQNVPTWLLMRHQFVALGGLDVPFPPLGAGRRHDDMVADWMLEVLNLCVARLCLLLAAVDGLLFPAWDPVCMPTLFPV